MLTLMQKNLQGTIFGGGNPHHDIPQLLSMYKAGKLNLDDMITRQYKLEQINEGYADMLEGATSAASSATPTTTGSDDQPVPTPVGAGQDRRDVAAQPAGDVADGDHVRHPGRASVGTDARLLRRACQGRRRADHGRRHGDRPSASRDARRAASRHRRELSPRTAPWSRWCTSTAPRSSRRSCTPVPTASGPRCTASLRLGRRSSRRI